MIEKVKKILKANKSVLSNFSYLSAMQVFNLALPLLTYPYLIRVLGKEAYGLVIFAQAIISYFMILVSFGFNMSATKEVSVHRDDKEKLSEIVSSIYIIKGVLLIASFIVLLIAAELTEIAKGYNSLFYLTFWICWYEWIFPLWYFQGIEKMKFITFITLLSRLIFVALIFILIQNENDFLFYPIINGIGALISGVISLYIVFFKHQIKFKFPKLKTLSYYLKESAPIFVSQVSIKIYVNSNKVIIGSLLGLQEVAYYDLAEKMVTVLKTPQGILGQALFPKISKDKDVLFVRRVFKISVLFNVTLFLIMLIFVKPLVLLLGGIDMTPAIPIVIILGLTAPIVAMSNVFGVQLLIPFGYNKAFSKVILMSGLVYLLLVGVTWTFIDMSIELISTITVLTELYVTLYMFHHVLKYNLWKKRNMII
ncbi:flippase [Arenibacter amylolyticus]|uniref:flippase n=1 Tax=Arenibacter amylolyticus TaxID=1406873 RepID=UPI000A390100|nr:flippase [Arenibacter amylolyticus]